MKQIDRRALPGEVIHERGQVNDEPVPVFCTRNNLLKVELL